MVKQDLSPQSPNASKYDDAARRRLANSFRIAKKRVGKRLAFVRVSNRRVPPRRTEGRARRWASVRKLNGTKAKGDEAENGGPDQLYQVVSEGQRNGEDAEGNAATFLAPDALANFCCSFDLSVQS